MTGIFKQHFSKVPVISVGNLTMGGTGKTPTVLYLAEALLDRGFRPAIISRGYGGKLKTQVNIVSDGNDILLSAEEAGDEPYMMATSLLSVPVITGSKRYLSVDHAINTLGCNLIILDDGFQHLAVARDIDLVLFNNNIGFGNNRVFPGGDLRESRSALDRSDYFLITGKTDKTSPSSVVERDLLSIYPDKEPIPVYRLQGTYFHHQQKKWCERADIPKKALVFSGIANPIRFKEDLTRSGFSICSTLEFADHISYGEQELAKIVAHSKEYDVDCILTTEKDRVKLGGFLPELPLYSVCPRTEMPSHFIEDISSLCLNLLDKKQKS